MEGGVQTFLDGSVDHLIYWDYIVNRNSFISCSMASVAITATIRRLKLQMYCSSKMHVCSFKHILSVASSHFADTTLLLHASTGVSFASTDLSSVFATAKSKENVQLLKQRL